MSYMITVQELTKKYGDLIAVSDISFKVRGGECFGILGPNGAGKTSTMRVIQCVFPKASGKVEVGGLDVDQHPEKIKKILGFSSKKSILIRTSLSMRIF